MNNILPICLLIGGIGMFIDGRITGVCLILAGIFGLAPLGLR